jgi:hypothetical protein
VVIRNFYQVRAIGKSFIDEVNENSVESSFFTRSLDLFRGFQHNFFLSSCQRHTEDTNLHNLLRTVRRNSVTPDDRQLLSRLSTNLPEDECVKFEVSLLVGPRNITICQYNNNIKLSEFSNNILTLAAALSSKSVHLPSDKASLKH